MAETLLEKAQRLGIEPSVTPTATPTNQTESLLQKAERLGIQPASKPPTSNAIRATSSRPLVGGVAGGKETLGDIKDAARGVYRAFSTAADNQVAFRDRVDRGERTVGEGVLQFVGQGARAVSRSLGELTIGVGKAGLSQGQEESVAKGFGSVISEVMSKEEVKNYIQDFQEFKKENPRAAENLDSILGVGELALDAFGGFSAKKVGTTALEETIKTVGDVVNVSKKVLTPSEKVVQRGILNLFKRSIKPRAAKTAAKGAKYEDDVLNALTTIKKNSSELNITDVEGEIVSRTPQTLDELAQSVDQTKKIVFNQYDSLAKQAGEGGATISAKPIAEEVLRVTQNKALQITNPEVIKYAEAWAERLQTLDVLDTETTQAVIQNMNSSLQAFYRNPTYDAASKVTIDAAIANNFRKALDEAIETATGEQYQVLKRQYGALKAIEDDVIRAAARDARKNTKGLLDYSDIFTSGQMIGGIMSMNPAMFTKGAVERGFKEYFKFLNDPNRAVSNMFEKLDDLDTPAFEPQSAIGQAIANQDVGLSVKDVSGVPKSFNAATVAKKLDETDTLLIDNYLRDPSIENYTEVYPILEGMKIENVSQETLKKVLVEVMNEYAGISREVIK